MLLPSVVYVACDFRVLTAFSFRIRDLDFRL